MSEQSSMHSYLNWTKQRIDEMDATLASLEAKAGQVQADSKVKANQLIADLKKQRDEFQTNVKKQAVATEAAWKTNKAQMDSQWKAFEAQVTTYIDTVAKQAPQQQALFRDVATAQVKAWREAAGTIQDVATKFAAGRRADVEAAVQSGKAQLETQWKAYEAQVKTYFDTVSKQVEQQQATFRDVATAQIKAWREAADTFQKETGQGCSRAAGRRRCRRQADEGGCHGGGSTLAKAETGGKRVLGGAERGVGGVAQGF